MIKIYTTPTCVFCETAKEFLKKKKIKYQEIDVSRNEKFQKEMLAKSHQYGLPVIDVNGKILTSFNQIELENALRLNNRRRRTGGRSRGRVRRPKKT
jgi:glutaredoxin